MILDPDEIKVIIRKTFGNRFTRDFFLMIPDDLYFCPSLKDVKAILEKSKVDRLEYIEEKNDCDDFAILLKADFVRLAYEDKERIFPYAFGEIMGGKLQGDISHAINFVITNKQESFLIEPQTDTIKKPTKRDREIYFIRI